MNSHILLLDETISTNTYLKELILADDIKYSITVYTNYQTAGRGQRGNVWESERGLNLLFSTLFFPHELEAHKQFQLSEIISLSIKNVLDKYTDNISIKWPNDIYWKDKKIAGILIENAIEGDKIKHSIIGVGLNLNQELFESNAPNPISLYQIIHEKVDVRGILDQILEEFNLFTKQFDSVDIHSKYMQSLFRKEGYHPFKDHTQIFKAKIYDVKSSGLLVLLSENGMCQEYAFKEIQFVL